MPVTCRLDTAEEVSIYEAGGVLQRFAKDFLKIRGHSPVSASRRPHRRNRMNVPYFPPQIRIPATYMRGGTSKGVFFRLQDLPERAQVPGEARDALLLRVIGSPDPYGKQIDGMGGATSSTSKCVILSKSAQPDHDVDYLFGQVSIDKAFVDWSGNCGNLSAGGRPVRDRTPAWSTRRACRRTASASVRIWQANIGKTIIAHVPVTDGAGAGNRRLRARRRDLPGRGDPARVHRSAAEEGEGGGSMFPTGNLVDDLEVPGVGTFKATMINAGIPTVFVNAEAIGYTGTELQDAINGDPKALERCSRRSASHGALRMGLIKARRGALKRQHTPKIAFVAPAEGLRGLERQDQSRRATSTCSCARSRWASCTTR